MIWSSKPRVVVDTNVFVSGLLFGGNPGKILEAIKEKKLELVISPEIEVEILEKLEKFGLAERQIKDWKQLLENTAIPIIPKRPVQASRDTKDNKFLAAAGEANAEFLVSGDKDLLVLGAFEKTAIVTPKQMLEVLG